MLNAYRNSLSVVAVATLILGFLTLFVKLGLVDSKFSDSCFPIMIYLIEVLQAQTNYFYLIASLRSILIDIQLFFFATKFLRVLCTFVEEDPSGNFVPCSLLEQEEQC